MGGEGKNNSEILESQRFGVRVVILGGRLAVEECQQKAGLGCNENTGRPKSS